MMLDAVYGAAGEWTRIRPSLGMSPTTQRPVRHDLSSKPGCVPEHVPHATADCLSIVLHVAAAWSVSVFHGAYGAGAHARPSWIPVRHSVVIVRLRDRAGHSHPSRCPPDPPQGPMHPGKQKDRCVATGQSR